MSKQTTATASWWKPTKKGVELQFRNLGRWLARHNFGQFRIAKGRLSSVEYFQNVDGVLKVHSPQTAKDWILFSLETEADPDMPKSEDPVYDDLIEKVTQLSPSVLEMRSLKTLPKFSEEREDDAKQLKIFRDRKDVAHLCFQNGVVCITSKNATFQTYAQANLDGAVWETSRIDHEISHNRNKITNAENWRDGKFAEFAHLSMMRRTDKNNKDWRKNFDFDDASKQHHLAMMTALGCLLHNFNDKANARAIFFIDAESDEQTAEGGNGKSLVMNSVKYLRKISMQDGKRFRSSLDAGGGRFQFSNVTLETGVVMIDDIHPQFDFAGLYNMITGDMEIERKGQDKIVIPAEKKPKLGITTNYFTTDSSTSTKRRQFIVEFGAYWNAVNRHNESPSDTKHLGIRLFDDFDDNEWDLFYSFMIECLRLYLAHGLAAPTITNSERKSLRRTVEGTSFLGFVDWMESWLSSKSYADHLKSKDGISLSSLFKDFEKSSENPAALDISKFDTLIWDYCKKTGRYNYNAHKSGENKSQKRWLRGTAGNQHPHLKITKV